MSERVGERIDGVIVAKTSTPVMRVSVRENLGADPRGKTQQQLIMMLTEHFAKDATRLIGCDACNGYSDKDLKGCPYCGAADEVPDASVSFEEGESGSDDNVVVLPQTKVHKAELVPNVSSAPTGADQKIQKWVQQFEKVRCMSALTEWKMGKLLNEARDTNLWRLKVGPTGKLVYTNFFKFVEAELHVPKTNAYSYMLLAESFEESVIERFSRSIISASLNAPTAVRGELFAGIQAGLSEEELLGKIQTLRRPSSSKEAPEQVDAGVVEERAKLVTLVSKPTRQRVKLFMSGDEDKRAKRIGDRPKGLLELERGTLVFEVGVDEAGNMELIVKALPPERC